MPVSTVCQHIHATGGNYASVPNDSDSWPHLFCEQCWKQSPTLPPSKDGCTQVCMSCFERDILPRLGKCIFGEPVETTEQNQVNL